MGRPRIRVQGGRGRRISTSSLCRFFTKKVGYMPEEDPSLPYVRPSLSAAVAEIDEALDVDLAASGGG